MASAAILRGLLATAINTDGIKATAPHLYGTTLVQDPIAQFIPRSIWPNKPEELGGRLRADLQTANLLPTYVTGGFPPGIVSEFWLNFRIFGLFLSGIVFYFATILISRIKNNFGNLSRSFGLLAIWLMTYFWIGGHTARFIMYLTMLAIGMKMLQILSNKLSFSNRVRLKASLENEGFSVKPN